MFLSGPIGVRQLEAAHSRLGEATGSGGRYQEVIVAEVRGELELWLKYYAVRSQETGAEEIVRPSERV